MLKRNNDLIANRGLIPANINCSSPQIADDNAAFIEALIAGRGVLPPNPPFEIHPYLNEFPLQNYEKYIIGTFPPISYILDNQLISAHGINFLRQPPGAGGRRINRPEIPFFHGNKGLMWDYLLNNDDPNTELTTLYNFLPLNRIDARNYLIDFLHQNQINYSDIIYAAQRNKNKKSRYDGTDENLNNICINSNLLSHILGSPKAKYLIFNSGSPFGTGFTIHQNNNEHGILGQIMITNNRKSFDLFTRGCQEIGLKLEFRINNYEWVEVSDQQINIQLLHNFLQHKIIFQMRISKTDYTSTQYSNLFHSAREFMIITPISPAGIRGAALANLCFINWANNNNYLLNIDSLKLFLKYIFNCIRMNDFNALYNLNV